MASRDLLSLLLLFVAMESGVKSTEVSDQVKNLAQANNEFSVHLYQTLQGTHEGQNLFFSPLSISTALAMTHLGARGNSLAQLSKVLRFDKMEESKLHDSFRELNSLLYKSAGSYVLRGANKLYGKAGVKFVQEFLDSTKAFYGSALEAVEDFTDPAVQARINDWVSQQTEGKIRDLISPDHVNTLTKLILINAIYFKGKWDKPFEPEDTEPGTFRKPHEAVLMDMMSQSGWFQISDDKTRKCFVLEMPYVDKDLSMLAVLPWETDGLASVEAQLSQEVLDFWDGDLMREKAEITFPRFKLEDTFSLPATLAAMGMTDPFSATLANFEGISGDRSLFISEVIHKSFIEVNEEGSEAAAATAVHMMARSIAPRPYELKFDHPFMFLIRDRRSKAVLFMGRIVDPPHDSQVQRDEL
ncbi:leukocyte elastase inhibitor-like isoform X1 [Diadema setosum]|uniref:leukocyte elastase inhibitor-like isoform X1 n=2 Tax=Diadema setosum TaxID=31175 RepID=UPI003B3AD765